MIIKFAVDGTDYDYNSDELSVFEARLVKSLTGMSTAAFLQGLAAMDGDSLAGMIYLAKRRAGEDIAWDSLDELNLVPVIETIGRRMAEANVKALAKPAKGAEPKDAA
jgi:hypothetical protein